MLEHQSIQKLVVGQFQDDIPDGGDSDAHQIALELMKQLITLASGIVALSATFIEKLGLNPIHRILLG
ncbi:MAG: hypothetical protein WA434_14770, partial [Candidatus Acidiferrales bacterium]